MSVVNKMLNDLENREQQQGVVADYQPPEKKRSPLVWFLLLALLIVAGVAAYMQFGAEFLKQSETNTVVQTAVTTQSQPDVVHTKGVGSETENEAPREVASRVSQASISSLAKIAEQDALRNQQSESEEQSVSTESLDNTDSALVESEEVDNQPAQSRLTEIAETRVQTTSENTTVELEVTEQPKPSIAQAEVTPPSNKVGQDEPSEPEPRSSMAVKPSEINRDSVEDIKLLAQKALADKNSPQAINLLSQVLNEQPDNVNARKQLASLFFANGESGKAGDAIKIRSRT